MSEPDQIATEYPLIDPNLGSTVLDSIEDAVSIIRLSDYHVLWSNRAFREIHGESPSEVPGLTCYEITHHLKEPCDGPDHRCPLKDMVQDQTKKQLDHVHYDENGHVVFVEISVYPIYDSDGEVRKAIHISRDITIRKELENRLVKKTADLTKLNLELKRRVELETQKRLKHEEVMMHQSRLASMGEMISAIAHQWKQPLNELSLIAGEIEDRIEEKQIPSEHGDLSDMIYSIVHFMNSTIDDFRSFLKSDSSPHSFDLYKNIQDVLGLLARQLQSASVQVQIQVLPDSNQNKSNHKQDAVYEIKEFLARKELASFQIPGNGNEFRHVILNMIHNAEQSMKENPVDQRRIFISTAKKTEDRLILSIQDTGPGIKEGVIQKIFERSFTTKDGNSGLGLYLSRLIVEEKMGGSIVARNTGNGALFELTLPITG